MCVRPLTEAKLRAKWDDPATSVDWRRQVVMMAFERVEVASAKRVGRRLADRVDPKWKA